MIRRFFAYFITRYLTILPIITIVYICMMSIGIENSLFISGGEIYGSDPLEMMITGLVLMIPEVSSLTLITLIFQPEIFVGSMWIIFNYVITETIVSYIFAGDIGKRVLGLKVRNVSGKRANILRIFVRTFAKYTMLVFSPLLLLLGVCIKKRALYYFYDKDMGLFLYDKLAGTRVISTKELPKPNVKRIMIHIGTKELRSQRLLLRKFLSTDAEEMFRNWANDEEVSRFLSWEPHGTIAVTQGIIDSWIAEYDSLNSYNWAIVFENTLIGSISLLNLNDETCEAEAGYCMSKAYWRKGIMPEALSMVLNYSFKEVGFTRIVAKHSVENPASGVVMKKCNMQFIERKNAPLALKPEKIVLSDCYEIFNLN